MTHRHPPAAAERPFATEWDLAMAIVAGAAALRLALSALIPLFPDETYYWEWSRHLAAGYFDHPWGIAALIAGGTRLASTVGVGPSPVAVRLLVIVAGFVASLAGAAVARRLAGDRAALVAALVFVAMPLAAAGLVLATPDVPLLATAAVTLYAVVRALDHPARSRGSLLWWTAAGIALGLAFSSKYTSILVPVGVVVAIATSRELRGRLLDPGPYVACVVATAVFAPVLVWNARHGWISFGFQLSHGLGAPKGSPVTRELNLLGGQAGLATPIILALLGVAVWRGLRAPRTAAHYLLAVVTTVCGAMFVVSALRRPVEANWPALAYVSGVPLLAATDWGRTARRWLGGGIALAAVVSGLVYLLAVSPVVPLRASRDPIARSAGWGQLADSVAAARRTLANDSGHVWIAADKYQDASELSFHLPELPVTFSTNLSGRPNQYDLWPGFAQVAHPGDDLVLVLDEVPWPHHTAVVLTPFFTTVTRAGLVPLNRRDGQTATTRRIWILRGWKGGWPSAGQGG